MKNHVTILLIQVVNIYILAATVPKKLRRNWFVAICLFSWKVFWAQLAIYLMVPQQLFVISVTFNISQYNHTVT